MKEKERRAEEEPNRHHENDVRTKRKDRPGKEKGKAWTKGRGEGKEGRGVCRRVERVTARLMFLLKTMRALHDDPSAEGEKGADQAGDSPP